MLRHTIHRRHIIKNDSTSNLIWAELSVYDLDLFVEHLPGKPVNRNTHLIAFG